MCLLLYAAKEDDAGKLVSGGSIGARVLLHNLRQRQKLDLNGLQVMVRDRTVEQEESLRWKLLRCES